MSIHIRPVRTIAIKKQPTDKFKQPGNLFLQSRTRKHQVAGFFLRQTTLITCLYEKRLETLTLKNTQGATYKPVSLRLEIIYSIPIPPESDYSHSIVAGGFEEIS